MKYKNLKYSLLIIPVIMFLIWVLFFNTSNKLQDHEIDLKKENRNSVQLDEIKTTESETYKVNSKPTIKEKSHHEKIKDIGKKQQVLITKDNSESLNKDTLVVQNSSAETENENQNSIGNSIVTRASPIVSEIPTQIILFGEKFPPIDLKQFVIDMKDNPSEINWQFSGNKNINVSITTDNILNIELPEEDWYGSDTLTLVAINSANLSSSTKIIFEVSEPDLINRSPIKPVKDALILGVEDVLSLTINPLNWETNDYIKAASIIGGTFLLTRVDNKIKEKIVGEKEYQNNTLMNIGKFYGETSTVQYTSLGITLLGFTLSDKKIIRLGLEAFESYLIADRITYILKYAFGRDRPRENNGALTFSLFADRENNINSLPSGHATNAFALSTVLSSFTDNLYLKILIYSPAFITAVSRVYQNYHWTSDVFLGGAIGYVVGSFIVNRHSKIFSDNLSLISRGELV